MLSLLTLWEYLGLESLPKNQIFQIIKCLDIKLRGISSVVSVYVHAYRKQGTQRNGVYLFPAIVLGDDYKKLHLNKA